MGADDPFVNKPARPASPSIPKKEKSDYRSQPCYRYELVGCHRNVLYIGITNDPVRRLKEHEREGRGIIGKYSCPACKIFPNFIYFPSPRDVCESLEKEIIQIERPIFNTAHNPDYPNPALAKRERWRSENCGQCQ